MLLNCGVGEDSWESLGLQGDQTSILKEISPNIHWTAWCWTETPILWPPDVKNSLIGKDPSAGKGWKQEEKEMTEDEMVGCHHWVNGHGQALGVGDGKGKPDMLQSWGHKKSDMTERLNWNDVPTTDAQEAEVDQFYEDLQILLEVIPKKMSFAS